MKRWQYIAIMLVALVGIILSIELTHLHIKVISEPDYQSFCNISDKINCDAVNSSKYSEVFSIPISHLGLLTYIFIFILAFFSLKGDPSTNLLNTLNLLIFIFCNLYSAILFFISLTIIKSLCILCCGLYIVNLALLIIALFNVRSYFTLDISCPLRRNRSFAIAILIFVIFATISSLILRNLAIEEKYKKKATTSSKNDIIYKDIDISNSLFIGDNTAPITIVEVSDFECPYCRKLYPIIKELINRYKDKVRFVFKNFPLSTECNPLIRNDMHPNACFAAYASVCAAEQNRFWDYIDRLMSGQLGNEAYIQYALQLNLDIERFKTCLESNITKQTVIRDIDTCIKSQIVSVPTVFINGRMIIGAKPLQEYLIIIEEELRRIGK